MNLFDRFARVIKVSFVNLLACSKKNEKSKDNAKKKSSILILVSAT